MLYDYLLEYNRYLNLLGILVILLIAFIFSRNRSKIKLKLIVSALILQFIIAFFVLKTETGKYSVDVVSRCINQVYLFADEGTRFLFGNLADSSMPWGFIFAFKILPIIIFFGALTAILSHFGIIQFFVYIINLILRPILGTSGAETLCAVANSFLGQTEAPLLIRDYLSDMTKSELFVVMVSGMATISGSILAVFASMGIPAKHMLAASVMAIPASILIAKIILPETEESKTSDKLAININNISQNVLDAISKGTSDGLSLAVNVGAMLIVFISLIFLINYILYEASFKINSILSDFNYNFPILSLNYIFGIIFAPFAYLLGLSGQEAINGAELLGIKVSINELVAYSKMLTMNLSQRSQIILTYALCGFSNFSCIGIQIGGIGALIPEKRHWITELGLLAVLASSLANLLSALIAGLLL